MDFRASIVYKEHGEFKQVLERVKCYRSLGKPCGRNFRARIVDKEHEFKQVL